MQEIELTGEQRLYLQRIFGYLRQNNKWPTHDYLDKIWFMSDAHLDIEEIVQSLPPGLTSSVDLSSSFSKATLTVPAIYLLQANASELDAFLTVIKLCVKTYINLDAENRQMSSTVLQDYPIWKPGINLIGLLLQEEPGIWSSFETGDSHWSCKLIRQVRRFRDIETIEDYLEKRDLPAKTASAPVTTNNAAAGINITAQYVQLHPDIHAKCWRSYIDEDYDTAILNATKAIEVAVRKKSNLPDHIVGADLIVQAFRGDKPVLAYSTIKAEQEGMMSLLRGIIQVYKNPQSHRFVGIQNKSECLGILLICSNLLYTIDTL